MADGTDIPVGASGAGGEDLTDMQAHAEFNALADRCHKSIYPRVRRAAIVLWAMAGELKLPADVGDGITNIEAAAGAVVMARVTQMEAAKCRPVAN